MPTRKPSTWRMSDLPGADRGATLATFRHDQYPIGRPVTRRSRAEQLRVPLAELADRPLAPVRRQLPAELPHVVHGPRRPHLAGQRDRLDPGLAGGVQVALAEVCACQ